MIEQKKADALAILKRMEQHAEDGTLAVASPQDSDEAPSASLVDKILGYTTQAHFLVNCGITQLLARTSVDNTVAYAPLAGQVGRLTSPAEMGELFKVIAFGRGMTQPLTGFASGDRRHTL